MSDKKPAIGTKVMWVYGRRDYAEFGEIGVVTAHTKDGITVEIDDDQPYSRACFGSKVKRTGHARTVEFTTDHVVPLFDVYKANAKRMRAVAKRWDELTREVVA